MKKETMEALKFEEEQLVKKIKIYSERGEYGTYKNLVQALERILYLQERFEEDSKAQWNKYKMVKHGKEIDVISIWNDEIENYRVFEIKEEITDSNQNNINNNEIFDVTDYMLIYKKDILIFDFDIFFEYLKDIGKKSNILIFNENIYKIEEIILDYHLKCDDDMEYVAIKIKKI